MGKLIKLERCKCPEELTEEVRQELTNQFKLDNTKRVWTKLYIKESLLKFSYNKCAYCEAKLGVEGKDMQVEHFHPKSIYQDEVVAWNNLLPSCSRCNSEKSNHDTKREPIINPAVDDPKRHMYFSAYRFKPKDDLGKTTIAVLHLNDTDKIVVSRFKIGEAVQEKVETLLDLVKLELNKRELSQRSKKKIQNKVKRLMEEAIPKAEYSAVVATILLGDENYNKLKEYLIEMDIWDKEFDSLESAAKSIELEIK